MAPGRDEIETRIESLAQELAQLRGRVHRLEAHLEARGDAVGIAATEEDAAFPSLENWGPAEIVGLAGRTLVILGGAFALRAISAAALLPDWSGPALGLAYAAWWLWKSDRAAASQQRTSAFFYGLGAVIIADPLIWEATARFHLLPGLVAAPALVAFLALGLAVAWRGDLRNLSWIAVGSTLATALVLLVTTREFVLYAGSLLAAAATVEVFGFRDRWPELRWAPAAVLNVTLALLALLVSQPHMSAEFAAALHPRGIVVVSVLAPMVYLASVAAATLVYRRAITGFELGQVAASLLCGIGTALVTMSFHGGDPTNIAISITVIGVACYAVAFLSIDAEEHPRRNFYAYSSFAGLLVAVGTALLLSGAALTLTWFVLALMGIALGVHHQRNTLRLHGALYLAAAFVGSGLASVAFHGLLGPLEDLSPSLPATAVVVALGSIAFYATLAARRDVSDPHWSGNVPRFLVAAVAVWSIAGLSAPPLTALLLAVAGGLDQVAFLASMRTCVLSTLAAALAWAARRWTLDDLAWLVYPLMAATGARLAWEDLAYGEPVNLFIALGFYGGALIVTSRLLRQES